MADIEVARAVVTIVPSMEGAQKSITEQLTGAASTAGDKAGATAGSSFGSGLKKGLAVAGAATAAVAGVTAVAGKAFVGAASDVASYGDNIDKMSQKLGLSYEGFQKWDYVLGQSGTDINSMQTGLKTLTNKLDDAKNGSKDAQDMFSKLGISLDDINTMSREDLFGATITGFQKMADTTDRAALANDLFGKSGQNLTPLFNQSIEDTQALMEATEKYGMIMSDDAVKASADFNDALDTMQRTLGGLKNGMMAEFLPGITTVMDGLTAIVSGDSEGGLAVVEQGINDFVSNLTELAPKMLEIGASILESFAKAIIDNLPALMEAGLPIIMELIQAIIENLPALIEAGVQIIAMIAQAIGENLPTLIPAAVDAILTIVDGLIDNIDMLVDAAIAIIVGLAEGLINALPQLIERLPEIIIKIVEALIENAPKLLDAAVEIIVTLTTGLFEALPDLIAKLPELVMAIVDGIISLASKMLDAGKELVAGIWKGIQEAWGKLVENVKKLGGKLVDSVKGFFKIGSPSKLFADEVGQWIPEGIAVGIDANADSVSESVDDMVKDAVVKPNVGVLNEVSSTFTPTSMGMISGSNNSETTSLLTQYLPMLLQAIEESKTEISPDAHGIFNIVRNENNKYRKANGVGALA